MIQWLSAAALLVVPPLDTKNGIEAFCDDLSDLKKSELTSSKTPSTSLSFAF